MSLRVLDNGPQRSMLFVVFSDDWGAHPSSSQHLFREIAKSHRVVWVNTVGMRRMTASASDIKKAWRKLTRMVTPEVPAYEGGKSSVNVKVLQPLMLPAPNSRMARAFNRWATSRCLHRHLRESNTDRIVIVSTVPNAADVVENMGADAVVYYCVDDFSMWPGLAREAVAQMERKLVARADLVLATSSALYDRLSASGTPVARFDHGVDLEHFGRPFQSLRYPRVAHIPHPRAGFFGLLDERLDERLLFELASAVPQWSFLLAGPATRGFTLLSTLDNVHFIGKLPYSDLPAFAAELDVLLLPYVVDSFTHTLSPLKLNEYLATGLPVISSNLESVRTATGVLIASSVDEWTAALSTAVEHDRIDAQSKALRMLADHTWTSKAHEFLSMCSALVDARGSPLNV